MITNPQEFKDKLLEIQNNTSIALVYLPSDEPRFIIDANSRAITIPGEFGFLSLKKDHNAETIYFEIDRYFDGEDLSQHTCVVQYKRSDKEGVYAVKSYDIESVDGKIIFGWTITNEVTLASGDIEFSVRFYSIKDNKYVYNFNTLPAKSKILETLDIGSYPYEDILASDYEIYVEKVNVLEDTIITKADMQNEAGGFEGGKSAKAQDTNGISINSVQLGEGTNPNEKTLQVYDYQLMDASGNVPKERITNAVSDKAIAVSLTNVDINTIIAPGIYEVMNCTGLPDTSTAFQFSYGITMMVAPEQSGNQTKYLIYGGGTEGDTDSFEIYVCQTYAHDTEISFDLPWTKIFDSKEIENIKGTLDNKVNISDFERWTGLGGGISKSEVDSCNDGLYQFYGNYGYDYPYEAGGVLLQVNVESFIHQILFRDDCTIAMRVKTEGTWGDWKDVTNYVHPDTHPASMITGFSDAVKSCTDSIVAETGELPVSGSAVADIVNSLVSISGDYVIEPVIDDITEKFTLKASWVMMAYSMVTFSETSDLNISYNNMTYCLYAGETPLTASPLGVGESTTSASGAFEGNNITIRFYLGETEVFRAKLNTINIFGKKLGRLERI